MGGDQAAIGMEAIAYLNELQNAYERGDGCFISSIPSLQNAESESFRRLKKAGESDSQAAARLGCLRFKEGDAKAYNRHLDAGLGLADLYCDDYFRRIAVRKQTRQFGRSTTNDVGTATSVGLGLASAGSVLTGGAGALFGLADGIFRNYDTAFVVEPDLGKMLDLVKTAQGAMRSTYKTSPPASFAEANAAIGSYAQLCSYAGMDDLLNVALEAGSTPATIAEAVTRSQTTAAGFSQTKEEKEAAKVARQVAAMQRHSEELDKRKALQEKIKKQEQPQTDPPPESVEGDDGSPN